MGKGRVGKLKTSQSCVLEAVYMGCLDIQVLDLYVKTCINTAIS